MRKVNEEAGFIDEEARRQSLLAGCHRGEQAALDFIDEAADRGEITYSSREDVTLVLLAPT
jgi:hypothetical protein